MICFQDMLRLYEEEAEPEEEEMEKKTYPRHCTFYSYLMTVMLFDEL